MMLQHEDFFDGSAAAAAAASVLHDRPAADEELRGSFSCSIVSDS